eukprot:TRINITY_DN8612_c0_g1_i1.p1 TRINITY_DN8612_c0_g1~~TRINITY_DN8612_c0_g1_i1.p1  ORF type:complete len:332 (-),score=61.16 TRINITY_DN8612_c0_g1_i1:155-1117(-)
MEDDSQISISLYPHKLVIISIDRNKLNEYCHELLKFIIDKEKPFYSLTISNSEISLVTEEEYANNFQNCNKKHGWYALLVSVGASNTEGDLVQLTSSVLKEADIPIYYNSSFNDDFVLVEEINIKKALDSLSKHFSIQIEVDGQNTCALEHITKNLTEINNNLTPNLPTNESKSCYELRALQKELMMISLKEEEKTNYLQLILQLVFYTCNQFKYRFVNMTQYENEMSLLLDKESYTEVFNGSQNHRIGYKAIKRNGKKGLKEIGVINCLSSPLVQKNLRVLYLSTFLDAFMLVQVNDFDSAYDLLKHQDNINIEYEEEL